MPSNPQLDHCVQCGGELKLNAVRYSKDTELFVLPYCPNPACPNYGLVTVGMSGVDNG